MSLFAKRTVTSTAEHIPGANKMQLNDANKSQQQRNECFIRSQQNLGVTEVERNKGKLLFLRSQQNSGITDGESNKEKLLFLLQVASDPTLADEVSQKPLQASLSNLACASNKEIVAGTSANNEEIDEEEVKKQRRIQYALSVLNLSRDESEARMQRAILEAKQRRVQRAISSLTKKSSSPSSSVPSASPTPVDKLGSHPRHISACRTVPLAENAPLPSVKHRGLSDPDSGGRLHSDVIRDNAPAERTYLKRPFVQIAPEHNFSFAAPMKKARHNRKGTFPEKLMDVLSRKDTEDAIAWLPDGKSFMIVSPEIFVAEVLPRFFKQAKFESFTRKLNRWGFTRITKGTNSIAFSHECFIRGKPELCKQMGGGKRYEAEEPEARRQEALRDHMSLIGGMNATQKPLDKVPPVSVIPSPFMVPASLTSLIKRTYQCYPKTAPESFVAQETMNRAMIAASMAGANDVKAKLSSVTGKINVQSTQFDKKHGSLQPSLAPKSQLLPQQSLLEIMNLPRGNLLSSANTNEALSKFYECKMNEISTHYKSQDAVFSRGNLSQHAQILGTQTPTMSEAERKNYLHKIRENLLPPQNANASSVPSSIFSPRRFGGAA